MTERQTPKIFISYSWTSDDHTQWVADLGERMMSDGIDVVLDQWSLEDGHDVNAFMEQMVTDTTIKKVLVVCDALYAEKADGRKGGVGTETQIISKKVYESVDQTKFIPLLRERDDSGKACLPTFLASRKYIDFSNADNFSAAYEDLIRNIFERPRKRKPAIGKPPTHLFEDETLVVSCSQKAKRFKEVVLSGKGNSSAAIEDFSTELILNLEQTRVTYRPEQKDQWCETLRTSIADTLPHRDAFATVVYTGAAHLPADQFIPAVTGLLEKLLPISMRPEDVGQFTRCSEDNFKFLCYEFFLYAFTAFIVAKKYNAARQLLDHRYVAPQTYGGHRLEAWSFRQFNTQAESLEEMCGKTDNSERLSVMADLVKERANRVDLRFRELVQADMILSIAARTSGWYPRCMVYSSGLGRFELFIRAIDGNGFLPLKELLAFGSPQEMLTFLRSEKFQHLFSTRPFWHSDLTIDCLNFVELERCWLEGS